MEKRSELSEKGRTVSAVSEASEHIRALASPWRVGDSVEGRDSSCVAQGGLSLPASQSVSGTARFAAFDSVTMDRLRAAARDARTVEEARDEHRTLLARLRACEAVLGLCGEDVGRGAPAADGEQGGASDRTMDR